MKTPDLKIDCTKFISSLFRELEDLDMTDKLSVLGYVHYLKYIKRPSNDGRISIDNR